MKKLLSIFLCMSVLISVAVIPPNVSAASYEYAMFPMTYLNISQGVNGSFSHQGTNAIDITGKDSGIDTAYAPFTGVVKRIYQGYVVWLESSNPVIFADGTVDYMTIMVMHDNDTSDLYVGKKINQGERFFEEGTAGYATGNHIHLECAKGKFQGNGWYKNSQGQWMIYNSIVPYNALHLSSSTVVKNGYGYNWKQVAHTHNYDTYVYYWAAHPHYKCYKCSCGEVKENTSEPTYVSSCEQCNPPISYKNIPSGNYFIRNKGDNGYLNVAYGKDEDATTIHIHGFGNYDSQVYNIRNVSDGYEMMPLCSNTRVVNVYADTVTSGKTVNLYHQTNHSSQHWKFEPVEDGYVIRSVQNPNVCLTPYNYGIIVSEYTGSDNQIWFLEEACIINYDANGGSNAPAAKRVRAGYSFQIPEEQPTRKNYTFLGWSISSTAASASYQPGSSYTINDNLTLYAVWKKSAQAAFLHYGDINADDSINASDALMALQHSVHLIHLDGSLFATADVDENNSVNASDALYILQYSVKLIDRFPAQMS